MSNRKRKSTIFIDKIIGEPIFRFVVNNTSNKKIKINKKEIRNILLIRPGGIGDYLLTIPSFKRIRKMFPKSKITIFLFKRNAKCLSLYDNFDRKVIIDNPLSLINYLSEKKDYDLAIDFDQHRKIASILTLLSKSKIRIGFDNNYKGKAYNYPIRYRKDMYEADSFLGLLKPLGIDEKVKEKDLILEIKENKPKLLKNGYNIGIYASAMKEENRLPLEKWVEIIKKLGKNKNYYFIGTQNESARYDKLQEKLKGYNIIRADGCLSLNESLSLIKNMKLLFSEDGGVYHLGVCAEIPTISYWLHGKDNMKKWKAPFKKHKGVLVK